MNSKKHILSVEQMDWMIRYFSENKGDGVVEMRVSQDDEGISVSFYCYRATHFERDHQGLSYGTFLLSQSTGPTDTEDETPPRWFISRLGEQPRGRMPYENNR